MIATVFKVAGLFKPKADNKPTANDATVATDDDRREGPAQQLSFRPICGINVQWCHRCI